MPVSSIRELNDVEWGLLQCTSDACSIYMKVLYSLDIRRMPLICVCVPFQKTLLPRTS